MSDIGGFFVPADLDVSPYRWPSAERRVYFPQPVVVVTDVHLLTRPPVHAPTLAEAIRALCDGHGEPS